MRTAYICSPFGDPGAAVRAENIRRARDLAACAIRHGRAPLVVHGEVEAGTYGHDADPEARARGLAMACALALACDEVWVLISRRGITDGMRREILAAQAAGRPLVEVDLYGDWGTPEAIHWPPGCPRSA